MRLLDQLNGAVLLAIFIIAVIVYSPAARAPFYLDDNSRIVENSLLRSFSSLKFLWEYDPLRFIPNTTFAINYYFNGIDPVGYHVGNIAIHILNTFIVFFLMKLLCGCGSLIKSIDRKYLNSLAFAASLIFLLHPIQTSAVTYVVQRSTLLVATFYFSSVLLYILFKLKKSMVCYIGSLVCATMGVFCKPIIITLPFIIILCELFCLGTTDARPKRHFVNVVPYLLIIFIAFVGYNFLSFNSFSFGHLTAMTRETIIISRASYLLTQFNVLITYIWLLFFPFNQNLDYDYPIATNLFSFPTVFSFLFLVLLIFFAWNQRKKHPVISFCILWFFLALSSESSIFPISDVIFEHRLYIPMFGFALFLPYYIFMIFKNKRVVYGLLALIILGFSTLSYIRNDLWSRKTDFLTDVVKKSPNKARAKLNLGAHYSNIGNYSMALFYINKALAIEPDSGPAFYSKALLYDKTGQKEESLRNYTQAIKLNPAHINAYVNRGYIYLMDEKYTLALEDFLKALKINPQNENANNNIGVVYFKQSNYPAALDYFNKVVKINPRNLVASDNIKALESLLKANK